MRGLCRPRRRADSRTAKPPAVRLRRVLRRGGSTAARERRCGRSSPGSPAVVSRSATAAWPASTVWPSGSAGGVDSLRFGGGACRARPCHAAVCRRADRAGRQAEGAIDRRSSTARRSIDSGGAAACGGLGLETQRCACRCHGSLCLRCGACTPSRQDRLRRVMFGNAAGGDAGARLSSACRLSASEHRRSGAGRRNAAAGQRVRRRRIGFAAADAREILQEARHDAPASCR